ncbi:glycoside hydrolase family 6 protein [Leifsonia poae]|uniref:Glucanase n=1 Tax=Leifsonia poae TaxID=110933 RepID=A0A9W6HAU3_9MICO|nr:glycoside hydrolase family 6 protein [Leifsonia poae]GLJ77136.1 glucanase [Leifsonia poae]
MKSLIAALVVVMLGALAPVGTAQAPANGPSRPPAQSSAIAAADAPVFPGRLYVDPYSDARIVADWLAVRGQTTSAALIDTIADQPTAVWLGDWYASPTLLRSVLQRHLRAAEAQHATPVFVTYAIPNRDCGGYSAGGLAPDQYLAWNRVIASELAGRHAVVLVEPDSLAMLASAKCASVAASRPSVIHSAVKILASAGVATYLDGGNARWLSPAAQADRLKAAGIADARGFFTNVSNFDRTQSERDYAGKVSSRVGWKHFIIDVSRNGNGWTGTWCNPPGAALGQDPQITEGPDSKLDALLWVKHPGASDGTCNGGPDAGAWFQSAAESLVRSR